VQKGKAKEVRGIEYAVVDGLLIEAGIEVG
jgi:hypothetical protein